MVQYKEYKELLALYNGRANLHTHMHAHTQTHSNTHTRTHTHTQVVYAPAEHCDPEGDAKPWGIPGLGVKGLGPYFSR